MEIKMIYFLLLLQSPAVFAKFSSATLELRGVVPEVASVSTVSLNSDLDLRPGASVTSEKLGRVQIKLNNEISGIYVSSSTKSGSPENADNKPFQLSRPFKIQVNKGCKSLKTGSGIILEQQEKNIASVELSNFDDRTLSQGGINENCDLSASWSSEQVTQENQKLNSGLYSMYITVTLVSQ